MKGQPKWLFSIGHNVRQSKACRGGWSAYGYFATPGCPFLPCSKNLEAGASIDEIIEQFDITREQINTVLEFAARSLDAPPLAPASSPVDAHSV